MNRFFIILIFSSLIFSCYKENQVTESVSVKTTGATVSSSGGVRLTGALTAFQKVEEYGFAVSSNSNYFYKFYSLGRPSASGSFNYEVDVDLQPTRYVYTAYIRTGTNI